MKRGPAPPHTAGRRTRARAAPRRAASPPALAHHCTHPQAPTSTRACCRCGTSSWWGPGSRARRWATRRPWCARGGAGVPQYTGRATGSAAQQAAPPRVLARACTCASLQRSLLEAHSRTPHAPTQATRRALACPGARPVPPACPRPHARTRTHAHRPGGACWCWSATSASPTASWESCCRLLSTLRACDRMRVLTCARGRVPAPRAAMVQTCLHSCAFTCIHVHSCAFAAAAGRLPHAQAAGHGGVRGPH